MAYPTKYKQIYLDIKKAIEDGTYTLNSLLPSERLLCDKYDAQRMTVRKALDLLVQERYISKSRGMGSTVIYNPSLSLEKSSIFFIIPEHEFSQQFQPYHWEVFMGLEALCKKDNQNLYFRIIKEREDISSLLLTTTNINAIIWDTPMDWSLLDIAREQGIPSICICSDYPHFSRINLDDANGTFAATKHLIDQGCKRIVLLKGLNSYINTDLRLRGYCHALLESGLPIREELIIDGNWTHDSGYEAINKLLDSGVRFDAVLGSNDMMALGAMKALYQRNISVPRDIKIVGVDNTQYSSLSTPSLSTVDFSPEQLANIVFMIMNQLIHHRPVPNELLLPGKLILRESSQ